MNQIAMPVPSWGSLTRLFGDEPMFAAAGLTMLALCAPTLIAMAVDTRTVQGANPWTKPLKFELSLSCFS